MGLVACRQILRHYAGQMFVFSEGESKGTTFYFKIKMEQPNASRLQELQKIARAKQH